MALTTITGEADNLTDSEKSLKATAPKIHVRKDAVTQKSWIHNIYIYHGCNCNLVFRPYHWKTSHPGEAQGWYWKVYYTVLGSLPIYVTSWRPTSIAHSKSLFILNSSFAEFTALAQRIATTSGNQVQFKLKEQQNQKNTLTQLTHAREYFCTRPILARRSYIQWWVW